MLKLKGRLGNIVSLCAQKKRQQEVLLLSLFKREFFKTKVYYLSESGFWCSNQVSLIVLETFLTNMLYGCLKDI
jgi:uncharacterized protein (DUF486 family)